jgi:hypothetical protein
MVLAAGLLTEQGLSSVCYVKVHNGCHEEG